MVCIWQPSPDRDEEEEDEEEDAEDDEEAEEVSWISLQVVLE